MLTSPRCKIILRLALPLLLAAALGAAVHMRLGVLAARDGYAGHTVLINEVCAKNLSGYTDADGHAVPWVELCNVSGQDIDLAGYALGNTPEPAERYVFDAGTVLPGGEDSLLLLVADGQDFVDENGVIHIGLLLHRQDETLTLYAPDGSVADRLEYTDLPYDMTCGRRFGDAASVGVFANATPGSRNPLEFWRQNVLPADLGSVEFSTPGGFYGDTLQLTLTSPDPDALIFYTTDGSEPTASSELYTGPITVRSRAGEPNRYASQAATLYVLNSLQTNLWLRNYACRYAPSEVDKCTTVTARLYKDGVLGESVRAETYWVGTERPTLPVVSLCTAPQDLFGPGGIYTPGYTYFTLRRYSGDISLGNFSTQRNVSGSISILDTDGAEILQDRVKVHVSGGFSRIWAQLKNLHIQLHTPAPGLLDGVPGKDSIEAFVLRGSGNAAPFPALHQDAFLNDYLYDQGLGSQLNVPVALFLQGEYWGTYTVRESKNSDFFFRHFGVDAADLLCLEITVDTPDDRALMGELFGRWVNSLEEDDPRLLQKAEAYIDVDEYIRYVIAHMYINNVDGLYTGGNLILWRSQTVHSGNENTDGRWRFLLNDLDYSLKDVEIDPFADLLQSDYSALLDDDPFVETKLFQTLWQNEDFRARFAAALREEMATIYAPENLLPAWDAWCALLRPELDRDLPRQTMEVNALAPLAAALTWFPPVPETPTAEQWEADAAQVRDFFTRRADIMLQWLDVYLAQP